ncbi:MAG: Hpt domain-containing protein, partial [Myxococcota bacterium]
DYIAKPFDSDELHSVLERWCWVEEQKAEAEPQEAEAESVACAEPGRVTTDSGGAGNRVGAANGDVPTDSPIDHCTLDELRTLEDDEFVATVVELFLSDTPDRLAAMHEAVAGSDPDELCRVAHTLKYSCAVIGAHDMSALCADLEQRGRALDDAALTAMLSHLDTQAGAVLDALATMSALNDSRAVD